MSILRFERKTYTAKLFGVPIGDGFKLAGTLDGFIDFAVPERGTYQLTLDEARAMVAALTGAIEDVKANCLYDRDALLLPESQE
jgi:hypothetical protein